MTTCNPATGERYVTGLLNEAEESTFIDHLETCVTCRRAVEAAAGEESDWQAARELLGFSCESDLPRDPPDALAMDFLPTTVDAGSVIDRSSLTFLAPSDDPAMVGRIGAYEILGALGRGGFGLVLKGHDRALNRNVAIKVLDPVAACVGAARERFAREARAMAAISHEHVVPVYAVDTHAGLPYFVMEYVAGGSLERRLRCEGPFDTVSIVRVGLQMAQALAAAHRQGLVHRDIKPGNVLIDPGTERVRVADFGLARVASDVSATKSGLVAGTPQYMAPEQVRGETCDAQSDLFSLGAVMYALCTGHAPFRAETVYGVMQRIVHEAPRPIREQNPLIPVWLEQFILRLLQKDKLRRMASADEVARALQEELAYLQNPSLVPPPARLWNDVTVVLGGTRSRRRLISAGGTLAALILAGAFAVWVPPGPDGPLPDSNQALPAAPDEASTSAIDAARDEASASRGMNSFAPLWPVDGTRAAREFADRLDADWHAPATPPADSWSLQAAEVRRKLAALSSELEGGREPEQTGKNNGVSDR